MNNVTKTRKRRRKPILSTMEVAVFYPLRVSKFPQLSLLLIKYLTKRQVMMRRRPRKARASIS
jgi:hypothetical protein